MTNKLKLTLVALGLSAALAAGSATAGISWNNDGTTLFEDDDIDFVWEVNDGVLRPDSNNFLDEGDILISVLEFHAANATSILPDELTGIGAIEITKITPLTGTLAEIIFAPYTGGLNSILQLGSDDTVTVPGGEAGGGAMAALWLDPTPDLDISADNIVAQTVSCASLSECIDQAIDGALWEVDGFAGDPDEQWIAPVAQLNTLIPLNTEPAIELSNFNASMSILHNGTGQDLVYDSIACFPFCGTAAGANGFVDVIAGGSIKGGKGLTAGLIADGGVASSDFDMQKRSIPEPSTLALLAVGFLGAGAANRRRRKARRV